MKHVLFILLVLGFTFSFAQENQRYINVNGTSEIILPADQVEFTVRIYVVDESIEASKKSNDEYLNLLLQILKNTGISNDDIDVSPLSLGKNYELTDRVKKQNGFYTEVNVTFGLTDLSKYYELTNKLASNDNFEVLHSNYNISDYEIQHKAAYQKALIAAREKAEYMAAGLGVQVGDVLEIEENNALQSYPNPTNTISTLNYQTGDISGKVTIRRSVRVKFAIN
jgi:uncharacterized protein